MKTSTKFLSVLSVLAFSLLITGCFDLENETTSKSPSVVTYVVGLNTPWQIAFMPDGRMLVTERGGFVRVIENSRLNPQPYLNLRDSVVTEGETGLTGIAVDPDFSQNHYIYVGYTYEKSKNPIVFRNKMVRYKENPTTKKPIFDKIILDGIEGYVMHNTGPIKFGPDGKIYWPAGERYIPEYAQDMTKLNGKILRLNRDGTIPMDNPFPNSYIYTLGHRNSQGIDWQPVTNHLYNTEHGPSETQGCCMDEINLIEAGNNYGWPVIRGMQHKTGMVTPVVYSGDTTTWAPAGAAFIRSGKWTGSFVFGGLRGEALYRAVFNASDPRKIDTVETYFKGELGRIRTVELGPDGIIYIATNNRDGKGVARTAEDDRILILNINK